MFTGMHTLFLRPHVNQISLLSGTYSDLHWVCHRNSTNNPGLVQDYPCTLFPHSHQGGRLNNSLKVTRECRGSTRHEFRQPKVQSLWEVLNHRMHFPKDPVQQARKLSLRWQCQIAQGVNAPPLNSGAHSHGNNVIRITITVTQLRLAKGPGGWVSKF